MDYVGRVEHGSFRVGQFGYELLGCIFRERQVCNNNIAACGVIRTNRLRAYTTSSARDNHSLWIAIRQDNRGGHVVLLEKRVWHNVFSVDYLTRSLRYVQKPREDTTDAESPARMSVKHSAPQRLARTSPRFFTRMVSVSGSNGPSPSEWGQAYPTRSGRVTTRSYLYDRMRPSEHRLLFPKSGNIAVDHLSPVKTASQKAYTSNKMADNDLPVPRDPTEDEALALFKAIEERFPSKSLGDDKWYILTVR